MASIQTAEPRPDFLSHPSELELIETFLRPRIASGKHAPKFIHRADPYTADPDDLTREHRPATASDGKQAWYFFTSLRPKNRRGRRKQRTVASGDGCWHSEHAAKPVVAGIGHPRSVGYRQAFSFVRKEHSRPVRTGWIMTEIGLVRATEEEGPQAEELVLCKVYRSPRAGPATSPDDKAAAAAAEAQSPRSGSEEESAQCGEEIGRSPTAAPSWIQIPRAVGGDLATASDGEKAWIMVEIGLNNSQEEGSPDELLWHKVYNTRRVEHARDGKGSTAAASACGRKGGADDEISGAGSLLLDAARGAKKSSSVLCTKCGTEPAETRSETGDDDAVEEGENRASCEETTTDESDESGAHHRHETVCSTTPNAIPQFYHFI